MRPQLELVSQVYVLFRKSPKMAFAKRTYQVAQFNQWLEWLCLFKQTSSRVIERWKVARSIMHATWFGLWTQYDRSDHGEDAKPLTENHANYSFQKKTRVWEQMRQVGSLRKATLVDRFVDEGWGLKAEAVAHGNSEMMQEFLVRRCSFVQAALVRTLCRNGDICWWHGIRCKSRQQLRRTTARVSEWLCG